MASIPNPTVARAPRPCFAPLFRCSWQRAIFLHYQLDPSVLQKQIPFELDLHDGHAYVSLVAFTLANMRLTHPSLRWMTHPLHTHNFLNVRTYVRAGDRTGIYFLAEWLNNRLATMLGPTLYGLPYRFGDLRYDHNPTHPHLSGQVRGAKGVLRYRASLPPHPNYESAPTNSLTEFLLERYFAFTRIGPLGREFQVAHPPWQQTAIEVEIESATLIPQTGPWFRHAHFIGAHFSPGLSDVQMGWPQRLS